MKKILVFGIISLFVFSIILTGCQTVGEAAASPNRCARWKSYCERGKQRYCSLYESNCLPQASCKDTDGINYELKGTVSGISAGGLPYEFTDSCSGKELIEWYCDGTSPKVVSKEGLCPNGCQDGACIAADPLCEDLLNLAVSLYGKQCGDEEYNKIADIDKSGKIIAPDYKLIRNQITNRIWCQERFDDQTDPCVATCTDDGDCTNEAIDYCSADGSSACTRSTMYGCREGICVVVGGGGSCQPCPNGCQDGACLEAECKVDSDCPPINCIQAPCPINKCINGVCIPTTTTVDFTIKSLIAENQSKLSFRDNDNNLASIPLFRGNSGLKLGDYDDDLILNEGVTINKNDYLIVTAAGKGSYALRYKGANKVMPGITGAVKFDNIASGKRIEVAYDSSTGANLKLGGNVFKVRANSSYTIDDFDVLVDLNADGNIGTAHVKIVTYDKKVLDIDYLS